MQTQRQFIPQFDIENVQLGEFLWNKSFYLKEVNLIYLPHDFVFNNIVVEEKVNVVAEVFRFD